MATVGEEAREEGLGCRRLRAAGLRILRAAEDCGPYTPPGGRCPPPPSGRGAWDDAACGRGQNTRRPRAATLFTKEGRKIAGILRGL
jgi:hypothetical protein